MIFYSFDDITEAYNISRETLKQWCKTGKIEYQKLSLSRDNPKLFKYIIPESELVKLAERKRKEPKFNPESQPDYYVNLWREREEEMRKKREAFRYYMGEYWHSQEWQDKRSQRLKLDGYRCQICGTGKNLEVHHITYENMQDLVTLCRNCHERVHENDSSMRMMYLS